MSRKLNEAEKLELKELSEKIIGKIPDHHFISATFTPEQMREACVYDEDSDLTDLQLSREIWNDFIGENMNSIK